MNRNLQDSIKLQTSQVINRKVIKNAGSMTSNDGSIERYETLKVHRVFKEDGNYMDEEGDSLISKVRNQAYLGRTMHLLGTPSDAILQGSVESSHSDYDEDEVPTEREPNHKIVI